MIAVVHDEACIHRDAEDAEPAFAGERIEAQLGIDRDRDCRKDIVVGIVEDVFRDSRDSRRIQGTSGTQLGRQIVFVKDGDTAQHAERPHGDVVLAARFETANHREREGGRCIHGRLDMLMSEVKGKAAAYAGKYVCCEMFDKQMLSDPK
ncbi:hypothetical protein THIOKS12640021 [Thiocapsa sp. KS1]|nr:hypothetical protein THIOKS12640021 [Thiocapsa sp. KS1]